MPATNSTPPDDIFNEVDPTKRRVSAKRSVSGSIQTPPNNLTTPPGSPSVLSSRNKYLLLIGIIVIIVALGAGGYYWLTRAKTDKSTNVKNTNQPVSNNAVNIINTNQPNNENINTANRNNNGSTTNSLVVPADADHDGLSDEEERRGGTDPNASDTDKDGLSDKQEIVLYKSDPKKTDTDGDGNSDGDEVKNGYNPAGDGKLLDINKAINK